MKAFDMLGNEIEIGHYLTYHSERFGQVKGKVEKFLLCPGYSYGKTKVPDKIAMVVRVNGTFQGRKVNYRAYVTNFKNKVRETN